MFCQLEECSVSERNIPQNIANDENILGTFGGHKNIPGTFCQFYRMLHCQNVISPITLLMICCRRSCIWPEKQAKLLTMNKFTGTLSFPLLEKLKQIKPHITNNVVVQECCQNITIYVQNHRCNVNH